MRSLHNVRWFVSCCKTSSLTANSFLAQQHTGQDLRSTIRINTVHAIAIRCHSVHTFDTNSHVLAPCLRAMTCVETFRGDCTCMFKVNVGSLVCANQVFSFSLKPNRSSTESTKIQAKQSSGSTTKHGWLMLIVRTPDESSLDALATFYPLPKLQFLQWVQHDTEPNVALLFCFLHTLGVTNLVETQASLRSKPLPMAQNSCRCSTPN